MEKYLILFIISLSLSSFGQNCSMLKNGKYEIQYDAKERNSSLIEINGNHYYTDHDDGKKDYEIITLSNCSFRLKNNKKVDESKLTEFQNIIFKQKPYFEIIKVEGSVYYFVCRIDLHVQCGTGKFIKKEE
ncbi:hypothetical protein [Flavobacterium sp. CAN_S2]|uniref:hypothetical protein n=1 Tax=Flavobacterium sp. CAN_S2 TaxID=2787726 RepID=UPI0018CB2FF7